MRYRWDAPESIWLISWGNEPWGIYPIRGALYEQGYLIRDLFEPL